MSILIRGMEMPSRCWDCDLCYDKFYCKSLDVCLLGEQDKKYRPKDFDPSDDRLPNCPLVPVPPHGRLGDLDEMFVEFVDEGQKSKRYKVGEKWELNGEEIREVISRLPTIIPASE